MPSAKLISYSKDYLDLIKFVCSKPYGKNISDKALQNIINSGHLSVIEHAYASFDIECSVRVLGQITRHRHHSFTAQSARGKEFDTFIDGKTLVECPLCNTIQGLSYFDSLEDDYALEEASYNLPQGVKTTLVMTGNLRAWYEFLPKRLCLRAMPETRKLAGLIHEELKKAMPEIFDRNFMNCGNNCKETRCKFK